MTPLKYFLHTFYRPVVSRYLSRERTYRYRDISVRVLPGVFHPGFFYSTKFLLEFLDRIDLKNKLVLELGAGTGLISFYAEKKSAVVVASDISAIAIQNLELNKSLLRSSISIIKSDLFNDIPPQHFDLIIINPPYYPKSPINDAQMGWYCGEDFGYFSGLFSQMHSYIHPLSRILMVLSDDCDITRIRSIAKQNSYHLDEIERKKIMGELNFIFEIRTI